jgi:hypothetical protein
VAGGRVISGIGSEMTARTPAPEQPLDRADLATTHRLADGGVALAYTVGRELRVRRAAAGAPA